MQPAPSIGWACGNSQQLSASCELGLQVAAAISKATGKPVDEIAT
jgi:hypothetical protein